MLKRFKTLISSNSLMGSEEERGPLLNRLLFVQAHNAGMTGDDSAYLKILERTPGYHPSPSTLNYALMQMLYGSHMVQTSGLLPIRAMDITIARGAFVDQALAPQASWSRFFRQAAHNHPNPDFLTPLWHAVELCNDGRCEYLTRLLKEPICTTTLEHFLPQIKDIKMKAQVTEMVARAIL